MDISVIKPEHTNTTNGIHIGAKEAPVMIEFVNLRCPYCKKWFLDSENVLTQAVQDQKMARLIKLTNRQKESLQRGNVMHRYVDTTDAKQALHDMRVIFDTQDQWGNLSLEEVATFAEQTLGLNVHDHDDYAQAITDESEAANIKFVPTILFKEEIFDEGISLDDLTALIDAK